MHSSIALVLLFALASQAVPQHKLLKRVPFKDGPKILSPRIIGGEPVAPGEIPYQIGLLSSGGWFCGGALISTEWVLTLASCCDGARTLTIFLGDVRLIQGTQRISNRISLHPGWNSNTLQYDVALVNIPSVELNDKIGVSKLINANAGDLGRQRVRASGWGVEIIGGTEPARQLKKVFLTVLSNKECQDYYGGIIFSSILCYIADGTHGVCSGDNGGPVVLESTGEQVGIIGLQFGSSAGCASSNPMVLTRVSFYRHWIYDVSGV